MEIENKEFRPNQELVSLFLVESSLQGIKIDKNTNRNQYMKIFSALKWTEDEEKRCYMELVKVQDFLEEEDKEVLAEIDYGTEMDIIWGATDISSILEKMEKVEKEYIKNELGIEGDFPKDKSSIYVFLGDFHTYRSFQEAVEKEILIQEIWRGVDVEKIFSLIPKEEKKAILEELDMEEPLTPNKRSTIFTFLGTFPTYRKFHNQVNNIVTELEKVEEMEIVTELEKVEEIKVEEMEIVTELEKVEEIEIKKILKKLSIEQLGKLHYILYPTKKISIYRDTLNSRLLKKTSDIQDLLTEGTWEEFCFFLDFVDVSCSCSSSFSFRVWLENRRIKAIGEISEVDVKELVDRIAKDKEEEDKEVLAEIAVTRVPKAGFFGVPLKVEKVEEIKEVEKSNTTQVLGGEMVDMKKPTHSFFSFKNPNNYRTIIKIQTQEFTCLCPMTGQPDYAKMSITYVPDSLCLELKSLKLYLWSFRNKGAYHEKVVATIMEDFISLLEPLTLEIHIDFFVRGGIQTSIDSNYVRD